MLRFSPPASLIRCTATREDFQLKALGRIRVGNSHLWALFFDVTASPEDCSPMRTLPLSLLLDFMPHRRLERPISLQDRAPPLRTRDTSYAENLKLACSMVHRMP